MIQDLKDVIYHNEYKEQGPIEGDYIIFASGRSVLVKKESETIEFPRLEEINSEMVYRYLFQIDINGKIQKFFLGESDKLPDDLLITYGYERQNLFRTMKPD